MAPVDNDVTGCYISVDSEPTVNYRPDVPLSPADATKLMREIVRYGDIRYSRHCREESMPDSNFTFQDLETVLLNGEVTNPPERDEKAGNFKYKVVGRTAEGDSTIAITIFLDHRSILIVTVFSE